MTRLMKPKSTGLLPSAARAPGTHVSPTQDNSDGFAGLYVFTRVTVPGGGTVTVTVQGFDPLTASFFDLLTGAAISTATTQVLLVRPAVAKVANAIDDRPLPSHFRVSVAVAAGTVTFDCSAQLVP